MRSLPLFLSKFRASLASGGEEVAPLLRRCPAILLALIALALITGSRSAAGQAAVATLTAGTNPYALAVNPVTNTVYVTNRGSASVLVINGATNAIETTIPVGTLPYAIAVNPVTNLVYVANQTSGTVSVIDGTTNTVTATVKVGTTPSALAVNDVTNRIYVANLGSSNISVIDGASNTAKTITVGAGPFAVAVNAVTNRVYVANFTGGTVSVIDADAGTVAATVTVGTKPDWITINPNTNQIYVANDGSSSVSIIDGASNSVKTVTVGSTPWGIAVNPVTNRIYVTNEGGTTVSLIDGASGSVSASITVGSRPAAIAVNVATNQIYVANAGSALVSIINGNTNAVTNVSGVASGSLGIAVNPVTNMAYVANYSSTGVTVVDGSTHSVSKVTADAAPTSVAVNPVTNKAYVANKTNGTVTVIHGVDKTTTNLTAGKGAWAVAVNPVTNKVYVANENDASVSVIDGATDTVIGAIAVGKGPWAITLNPLTNTIYVANYTAGSLTVIDGSTNAVTATITVGTGPVAVAVDPWTQMVYVANFGANTVSVVDGSSNTMVATLIVGAAPWAVAINPATGNVYIANEGGSSVSVINELTNTVTATIGLMAANSTKATTPWAIAVQPATNKIYVADYSTSDVAIIDGASNALIKKVTVGLGPEAIAFNPILNEVYTANKVGNNVSVLSMTTDTLVGTIAADSAPASVAADPVTGMVYAANGGASTVSVIDSIGTQEKLVVPVTISAVPPADDSYMVTAADATAGTPYITRNIAPVFTASSSGASSTSTLFYQLDQTGGSWSKAVSSSQDGGPLQVPLQAQSAGLHTLYLYATYGEYGSPESSGNGSGNAPQISNVQAVPFVVMQQPTTTALATDADPQETNTQLTLTASVTPQIPAKTPTGSVSFYDSISGKPVLIGTANLAVVNGGDTASFQTTLATAGSHALQAVYQGDGYSAKSSGSYTETIVQPLALTQEIASITLVQGQKLPAFAPLSGSGGVGMRTYTLQPALPAGLVFDATTGLISGTPAVASPTTTYAGTVTDTRNVVVTGAFSLTVLPAVAGGTKAAISVVPSAPAVTDLQADVVTVTVAGSSGAATPSGIVTLFAGAYVAQATLANGTASFTIPTGILSAGNNTVAAYYSGDAVYAAGSGQGSILVSPLVIAVPPVPAIKSGGNATVTATLTAGSTYTGTAKLPGTVYLTCVVTAAPQNAQILPACNLSPSKVTLAAGGTATADITIDANALLAPTAQNRSHGRPWLPLGGSLLAAMVVVVLPRKRRIASLLLFVLAVGSCFMSGCGGGAGGPNVVPTGGAATPGTYTFTVTGVDSVKPTITTNVATVTVTVQ